MDKYQYFYNKFINFNYNIINMKATTKQWYQSKTIIMNIMVGMTMIMALLPTLFTDLKIDENLSLRLSVMVGFLTNIINIGLRFISTDKINRNE